MWLEAGRAEGLNILQHIQLGVCLNEYTNRTNELRSRDPQGRRSVAYVGIYHSKTWQTSKSVFEFLIWFDYTGKMFLNRPELPMSVSVSEPTESATMSV